MNLLGANIDSGKKLQMLYLIMAGIVIYPFMLIVTLSSGVRFYHAEEYMTLPTLLFLGAALNQKLTPLAKKCLLLSGVMVLWFVTAQTNHLLADMGNSAFGSFIVVYLLAFPYAAVTGDGQKHTGLKWIGGFYVAYSLLMTIFAGMLLMDIVPASMASGLKWAGTRAYLCAHPNGGACILMLGIGFSVYFMTQAQKRWTKNLWIVLTALQFFAQILTNSRTSIFLTCALFGGTLFFAMWNGTVKRFFAGAAAALTVMVVLFGASGVVFDLHSEIQINKIIQQTENNPNENLHYDEATGEYSVSSDIISAQGTLAEDMGTLNGRTYIWKAAFTALQDNPAIKMWGTEYAAVEISYRNIWPVVNAHNSWIQILMELGIPGFLLAVVYTLVAIWNLWTLVWRKQENLCKKVVALLVVCILLASIMEIYLFTGETSGTYVNFVFFLSVGYLLQWNTDASAKA